MQLYCISVIRFVFVVPFSYSFYFVVSNCFIPSHFILSYILIVTLFYLLSFLFPICKLSLYCFYFHIVEPCKPLYYKPWQVFLVPCSVPFFFYIYARIGFSTYLVLLVLVPILSFGLNLIYSPTKILCFIDNRTIFPLFSCILIETLASPYST